jgi:beta-lactamase regulating signal transducer with metallopeptidase domain
MSLLELLSNRAWEHLVMALLHTLWQGAFIALVMSVVLRRMPARLSNGRYIVALAAQIAVLLAGLLTWSLLEDARMHTAVSTDENVVTVALEPARGSTLTAVTPAERSVIRQTHDIGERSLWVPVLAVVWLVGVGLMLMRTTASVLAAWRLASGPTVSDPAILAVLERARLALGIGRLVRVCAAGAEYGPAVLGVIWPTLILPVSILTDLPAESLQLILIHELAHVRRYDYLINLMQMLIEAILFFNPAVWWIGRQVRLEREACCDAAVVRLTGRPLEYSRSLADCAGRSRVPGMALSWSGDGRSSSLLERIRRLLLPAESPGTVISISGLALLLAAGPLVLLALWSGTNTAVGLAAQVLSPKERVERVKVVRTDYVPPLATLGGKGTLKGTVRTPGGAAPARPINFYYSSQNRHGGDVRGSLGRFQGVFSAEVSAGTVWLSLEPEEYAPTVVGPFNVAPGATVDGIDIVLDAGFPAQIRVTDERGVPVVGARVTAFLDISGSSVGSEPGWVTDRGGIATIPHAAKKPYRFSARAPGFQAMQSIVMTPSAEGMLTLEIKHARAARGIAVDPEGNPVVGAAVRLFFEKKDSMSRNYSTSGPLLATTDSAGRFTLDTLEDDAIHAVIITSKAGGLGVARRIGPGRSDIRVTVGPSLSIKGTIKENPETQPKAIGARTVDVTQLIGIDDENDGQCRVSRRIPVDEKGHFTISGLLPADALLETSGRTVRVGLNRSETLVAIDLTRPVPSAHQRRVVLQFVPTDGGGPVTGGIEVNASAADGGMNWSNRDLRLEKGEAAFDTSSPGHFNLRPASLVGYWFNQSEVEVIPGEGAQTVEVPVVPAGVIVGQVLQADGQPAAGGVSLGYVAAEAPTGLQKGSIVGANIPVDVQGRFIVGPLPLGGAYVVLATRGHNRQVTPPVKIDGARPTARVDLRLSETVAAEGRVVGLDGVPLEGIPVMLQFDHPTAKVSWSPPTPTGRDGRFRFDDLSAKFAGNYRVSVESRKAYQPTEAALNPGGAPVEIRVSPGHVIQGRMVDEATGRPIPGVEIYAQRPVWQAGVRFGFEAEAKSDDQGRFRFSNLPDGEWQLSDRDGLQWKSPEKSHNFSSDGRSSIEIHASLPGWSKLKLAPGGND